MTELAKIWKIDLQAKLRDIDYNSISPSQLGQIEVNFHAIADIQFLNELVGLVDKHTSPEKTFNKPIE